MAEIRFNYGDKFTQTTNTNTGIGSTIPSAKLDIAGGDDNGDGNPVNNNIQFCTIATTGNALDFGDLTSVAQGVHAMSNSVRACFAMGNIGYHAGNTQRNVIDFVQIATTGNAQDFGDLGQARRGITALSDSHGGLGGY